jgi:hypothetical protein
LEICQPETVQLPGPGHLLILSIDTACYWTTKAVMIVFHCDKENKWFNNTNFTHKQKLVTMKKNTIFCVAFVALLLSFFSCSTVKNTAPTRIGLLPLDNYEYRQERTDTVYSIVQTDAEFNQKFRSAGGPVRTPAFTGQVVVAILLKDGSSPLRLEKAEVVGNTVHVYAQTCPKPDCDKMPTPLTCMATIPKVGNAKTVLFFVNGERKSTVELRPI